MNSESERPVDDVQRVEPNIVENRSASGTIIGTLVATGAAAAGVGKLAEGVAKLHESFSGDGKQASPSADKKYRLGHDWVTIGGRTLTNRGDRRGGETA